MNITYIISPIAALLFTLILIPIFGKLAERVQLVDKPNQRKVHQNLVPLVGGIAIFISTTLVLFFALFYENQVFQFKNIFIYTFILLIMGVLDDRFDIRATFKLAVQLLLAHFIFDQGIRIESLNGLFGVYELAYEIQYVLTILVIAGVVNAFNLMDGIDGLAAGLAILGFSVFAFLSFTIDHKLIFLMSITFIGSLLAFLRFNLSKKKKVFMGDAGSIVIGFILVVSGIHLLQAAPAIDQFPLITFGVITVMLVPVLDAVRVFRKRAKQGKSPFSADKSHLHHLILTFNLNHRFVTMLVMTLVVLIMIVGYLSFELLGLSFSIVVMLLVFYFITAALQFNFNLEMWKTKIKEMESCEIT